MSDNDSSPGPPAGVAILGMHRSGTSAVAGFLAKAGFFAGTEADILPAAEDNPKGFFEREDVNQLNDTILAELGGSWDKPLPRDEVREKAPAWRSDVEALLAGLDAEGGGRPLVLKDPRISLLLPVWLPALQSRFTILLVDRSPLEVAMSVRRRDGRPMYVALCLWQLYCSELLDGLAGHQVLVVRYENFVEDPAAQGARLLEQLAEVLPLRSEGSIDGTQAEGFVSADMRHHRSGERGQANLDVLTHAQLELARWLAELPEGWCEVAPPEKLRAQPSSALATASEYFDAMGDRFGMETAYDLERHKALHFEQATELKDQHIANIEAALGGLRRELDDKMARCNELEQQVGAIRAANAKLTDQLHRLQGDSKTAASNLLNVARRSLGGRPAGRAG